MQDDYNTSKHFKGLIASLELANSAQKGEIVAKLLLAKRITVSELSKLLGVERATIYQWVNEFNNFVKGRGGEQTT